MCKINPKHERYFTLEAFTASPDETKEHFDHEVLRRVFDIEQQLNADGRYRFHIHEAKPPRKSRTTLRCTCNSFDAPGNECLVHGEAR